MSELQTFQPDRSQYEIEKLLGEGLNSKVYQAIRIDAHGQSCQRVALKFLKSKSSISFLRREFETLSRVRSRYCARVIAWETRDNDAVLALEWIDGISLLDLSRDERLQSRLGENHRDEIVRQIYWGLTDLREAGLFHGDLQPSNILVDRQGCIRLIDFASGPTSDGYLQVTPAFAAPEVVTSGEFSFEADLFALGKIRQHFLSSFDDMTTATSDLLCHRDPKRRKLRSAHDNQIARKEIASMVESVLSSHADMTTQVISPTGAEPVPSRRGFRAPSHVLLRPLLRTAGALILILMSTLTLPVRAEAPYERLRGYGQISFRSEHWMDVQLNGRELGFAPQFIKRLSSGTHRITWKSALGAGEMMVTIKSGDRLRLVETRTNQGQFKVR